jgi:NitT/TauT family transport system ATP-binding protein
LRDGEIVAVLGKSGSGKSTFLRILAGLLPPSDGVVEYRGRPVTAPVRGIAMVFQSFALFPWLTVLGNVELGLEAQGVSAAERRRRAVEAIDIIGLDGFESAYPKELSGGMRQRVGFARALVVNPDILLLDEPFSQLDVLTAETLRNDMLDLWLARRIPTKGVLMVSHNIEEAVDLADRILIFSSDPGRISAEVPIRLPHPRSPDDAAFRQIVDQVYTLLTTVPGRDGRRGVKPEPIGLGYRLPDAAVQQLSGLIEKLSEEPYNGRADLPHLADEENLSTDELLPLIELLQLLGFAHVSGGDIELTLAGRAYAEADMLTRKQIFAEALVKHVPLAVHIRRVLDERPGHRAPAARFLRELEDYLSEEEAERVLETVINWGRHAEIFAYDDDDRVLSLENF